MADVGKFLLGAALTVAGIALLGTPLAPLGYGLLSVGANLVIATIFPVKLNTANREMLMNVGDTQAAVPVVYGAALVGLKLADVRVDKNSPDWRDLYVVGVVCQGGQNQGLTGGAIAGIEDIFFDEYLAFAADGTVQDRYKRTKFGLLAAYAAVTKHLGAAFQTVDSTLNTKFGLSWPASSQGRSLAYIVLKLSYNDDVYSGVPNVTVKVQGNAVYDVRDATWKVSAAARQNPALVLYDYLTAGIYGMTVPAGEIDTASFIAAANYCDETIDRTNFPDGPRFTCNGYLDTARSPKMNVAAILSSMRGHLTYEGGKFRLVIRRPVTQATLTLSPANIIGDWAFHTPGQREALNIIRASYVDPEKRYQVMTRQFPNIGAANGYLTADSNFENTLDLDLPMTNSVAIADEIGQVFLKESRHGLAVGVTCTEAALQLQVGDIVPVTHPTPGWTSKLFHVGGLVALPDKTVRLALIEYAATDYDYGDPTVDVTPPGSDLPDPFIVPPVENLTLTSDATTFVQTMDGTVVPRIKVTWTRPSESPFITHVEVYAKNTDPTKKGNSWSTEVPVDADDDPIAWVTGVQEGETWEVWARTVTSLGTKSDWAVETVVVSSDFPDSALPFYNGRHDWVLNGIFEEGGLAYWKNPNTGGSQYIALDTNNPFNGTQSLKLHTDGTFGPIALMCLGSLNPNAATRPVFIRVQPGDRLRFHMAGRTSDENPNRQVYAGYAYYNAAKQLQGYHAQVGVISESTWTEVEETAVIGAGVHFITPFLGLLVPGGAGPYDVWADEYHIWKLVETLDLGDAIVTSAKLATGAAAANIGTGGVSAAMLAAGAAATNIGTGGVSETMLATGAVTGDKIASGAVGADEIAAGAVGEGELADNAVTNAKVAKNTSRSLVLWTGRLANLVSGGNTLTFSVPAGTLDVDKQALRLRIVGQADSTAQMRVSFGSTVIWTGAAQIGSAYFEVEALIIRTGAATQEAIVRGVRGQALEQAVQRTTPGETLSGAVTLTIECITSDPTSVDVALATLELLPPVSST